MTIKEEMEIEKQREWLADKIGMKLYSQAVRNVKKNKNIKWFDRLMGTELYLDTVKKEYMRLFEIKWEKSK